MRKESLTILSTTAVSGAIGLFIRWLQNTSIFDAETGLARPNAGISWVFIALCAAVAVLQLILTLRLRYCRAETDYHAALHGRNLLFPVFSAVMGGLTAVGGLLVFASAMHARNAVLLYILAILAVFAGLSLLWLGLTKDGGVSMRCLCSAVPVLFYCFWLIVSYKENSANPVIWAYGLEILAICAAIIAWYFVAGYAFGRPQPMKTLFFCQLAAFLGIVSMADTRPIGRQLLLICPALLLLGIAAVLVRNLRRN